MTSVNKVDSWYCQLIARESADSRTRIWVLLCGTPCTQDAQDLDSIPDHGMQRHEGPWGLLQPLSPSSCLFSKTQY